MIVGHLDGLAGVRLQGGPLRGVTKKVLIGPQQGWDGWVLRVFDLDADGHTPQHAHDWPHINVVLEGGGVLRLADGDHELSPGSYAFVPAGERHQFRAAGEGLSFVCIVPEQGDV